MKTGLFCNYERYFTDNYFGLMGGLPFSLWRLRNTVSKYLTINNIGADKFLLARFFFVDHTEDETVSKNLPLICTLSQKRIANSTPVIQNSPHPQKSNALTNICYEVDYLLEN
jgi:hypothetical protein